MPNAFNVFGTAGCGTTSTNTQATLANQQGYNGNGNGNIGSNAGAGQEFELYRFWQLLAYSRIIPGTYLGMSKDGNGTVTDSAGENVPGGKLRKVCYFAAFGGGQLTGYTGIFDGQYPNVIDMGTNGTGRCYAPFMQPDEAFSLDSKIDDGKPGRGILRSFAPPNSNCATTSNPDTAEFNFTNNNIDCNFRFNID